MSRKYKDLCISCSKAILSPMLHNLPEESMDEHEFKETEYTPDPSATLEKLFESCELLDV